MFSEKCLFLKSYLYFIGTNFCSCLCGSSFLCIGLSANNFDRDSRLFKTDQPFRKPLLTSANNSGPGPSKKNAKASAAAKATLRGVRPFHSSLLTSNKICQIVSCP